MSQLLNLFTWVGGKNKLAKEIISMIPDHLHYVEVFFGSGVIFFNKPRAQINTINDFDNNLINLYIQVRDNQEELISRVYWTLFSRKQYEIYVNGLNSNFADYSDIDRAVAYLFLILASYQNMVGSGWSPSIKRNTADQFDHDLIPKIRQIREALDKVVIENQSFADIIPKYSTKDCLIYCDPPYYKTSESKIYRSNFLIEHHDFLCYHLINSKTNWMLSYDSAPQIIDMYKDYEILRLGITYNQKGKDVDVEELLITNFKHKHPQMDIFTSNLEIEEVTDEEKQQAEFISEIERERQLDEEAETEKLRKELNQEIVKEEQIGFNPSSRKSKKSNAGQSSLFHN